MDERARQDVLDGCAGCLMGLALAAALAGLLGALAILLAL